MKIPLPTKQSITYETKSEGLSGHVFYPSLAGDGNHLIRIIYGGKLTVELTFEIPRISAGFFLGICRSEKILNLYTEEVYPALNGKGKWSFVNDQRKDDSEYDKFIDQTKGTLDVSQIPFGFYTLKYEYGSCSDTRGIEIGGVDVFAGGDIVVCENIPGFKLAIDLLNEEGVEDPQINGNPIGPNTPYEWYWESKELGNYISGSTLNLTTVPAGTYEVDLVVYTYGEVTECEEIDTRKIIVEKIPEKPVVQGDEKCGPGEVSLKVLDAKEGLIYEWYFEDNNEVGDYTGFSGIEYKPQLKGYTNFYVIAVSKGDCESEPAKVTGIINYPPPTPEILLSEESICVGESITFKAGYFEGPAAPSEIEYIYNWYWDFEKKNPIKDASGPEYKHTFNSTDQNVIFVEIVDPETKCVSGLGEADFSVNPIPNKPEVDDISICEPGEVTLSVKNPQKGILYYWYKNYNKDGENDPIGEPSASIKVGVEVSSKYYVLGRSRAGCESDVEEVEVKITGKPEKPDYFYKHICGPGKVVLEAKGSEGATKFNWYSGIDEKEPLPNNDEGQIGKTFTTPDLKSSTSYYVEAVYGDKCISDRQEVKAYILAQPAAPKLISSAGICAPGGKVTLSTEKVERVENRWFLSENIEIEKPIHTGFDYSPEIAQTTSYFVVAVIIHEIEDQKFLCYSDPTKVTGDVYPTPEKPKVTQDKFELCEKGTVKFTASGLEQGIYNWYWDAKKENLAEKDKSEFSFEFTLSSNKKLFVEVVDPETNCVSDLTEVSVLVSQPPKAPQLEDQSICGPGKVLLKPLVSNEEKEAVFRFYPGEDTKYIHEGSSYEPEIKETTSFWVTRIIGETCESEPTKITITILEEIPTPIVDGFTNCGPIDNYKLEVKNPVEGIQYLWYENENDSKEASIGQGNALLLEKVTATKKYWMEAANDQGCTGKRVSVEVTILNKPDAPEVADGVSCGPGKVTLSIKNPNDNLIYRWFKSLENEEPVGTGISYSTEEITTNTKFYVIAYSFYGEGEIECKSEATEVEVQILESGEIGIGEDLQLCYDAPNYDLFQDLNIEGGTFSGSGVENGNQFHPKAAGFGKHEISFKYESQDKCTFTGTRIIEVVYPLNANEDLITKTEIIICSNEEFVDLTKLEKKGGGEWKGDGVENGKFYPGNTEGESGTVEYYLEENGCTYSAKVNIRLINVNLESPELSVNKPLFCQGDMVKLSVTNLDESLKYIWYNENSDSVGTGANFEFIASETETITCEAKNSLDCGSDQSSISVDVFAFPDEIIVSSNSIDQHDFVQFSLDSTTNTSYLWDFRTSETSTQRSPGYYFHQGGEFNVVVHMENEMLGCKDSLTTLIKVDFDQDDFVTGIDDEILVENIEGFTISSYPQPFENFIRLFLKSEKPVEAEIAIFSTDGKIMDNKKLNILKGEQDVNWITDKYPSGLYLIKINLPDYQKVIKALKQ